MNGGALDLHDMLLANLNKQRKPQSEKCEF
jgi:hypothetical protein